ncbi:MAG: SLC5 family protein, partial [Gemmataceae bacterium]
MTANLDTLDYFCLAAYLFGILALGVWVGRRIKTGADYFLAGKQLPWWAIGLSLVATDIGGVDIIGVGGAAFSHGLAVANFEWIGCVPAMIVAAFLFIPHFWRTGIYTIPEFLERRFNVQVRSVLALCWLAFMACNLGVMLLASGKLLAVLIHWEQTTCIIVTAVLVGIYTVAGGLAAVVYTDAVQCVVMIAGCLLVVVFGVVDAGGVGPLRDQINAAEQVRRAQADQPAATETLEHTDLVLPVDTPSPFPWPGILFGLAMVLSPAYWIGNPAIVQRAMGARTEFEAKASYVWGALLKNLIPVIIVLPGLIAVARLPGLQDSDLAIPQLVAVLLPAGLRGVFLAAFLAALMSSIDSYLNSAATILSQDLYRRLIHPEVSEQRLLVIGRVTTVALLLWAILFAILLTDVSQGVYAIFQTLMAFFQGPAFAVLLGGLLWRRATGRAAFVALLGGIATTVTLFSLNHPAVHEAFGIEPLFLIAEPYLYFSVWAFAVSISLLV